ncbi:Regulator of RNase E activity RraA [Fodinibius roseus]|uniref:Regulator of RNase E activity RraA n=1 Tax=Fodinibius roseus TaxID=1194090 RepID=A0A1M4VWE8_9BACT|nr:dimethylmenaquinone methyltransferase [Fodinibius roseus]SHE73230.1 Regulator of RNase E activity RraA [Fodinibius roseus]
MKYLESFFIALFVFCLGLQLPANGQTIPKEKLIALTPQWEGERFEDGRPRVPDHILERMEHVTIEEAWGIIRREGYDNQFEGGEWKILHPDEPIVGRALTATYSPARPGVQAYIDRQGEKADRSGPPNTWPIDMLKEGDVYVADGYGKVKDGTLIGDRLGNTIYANSGNGVVLHGSSRDREGLAEIDGFNAFVRDWHPSYIREMMLIGLNSPTRVGSVTVIPGDVVLAKQDGVIFIPAHLAERVVSRSEVIRARDTFAHERVRSGTYTAGQMDTEWTQAIEEDFIQWVEKNADRLKEELGVSQITIDDMLEE